MPRKQTKIEDEKLPVLASKPTKKRATTHPESDEDDKNPAPKKVKKVTRHSDNEPEPVRPSAGSAAIRTTKVNKSMTKRPPRSPSPPTRVPSTSHYKLVHEHENGETMKDIAAAQKIDFSKGEGYYELIKKEKVSAKKGLVAFLNGKYITDDNEDIRNQLLKLGAGDIDVAPGNVPAGYQLFVQSTSASRKIPAQAAVLFVVEGAASEDEGGSEAGSEDEDSDADSLDTVGRFEEHQRGSAPLQDTARAAFFKNANHYQWTSSKTGTAYIVWAFRRKGQMSAQGHKWPHAFVHDESQTVNAAAWAVGKKGKGEGELTLACVWTFSPGGDETNEYYLKKYLDDMCEFSSQCEGFDSPSPITDEASREHFSVSSGDYLVPKFHCPALENITAAEMAALQKKYTSK